MRTLAATSTLLVPGVAIALACALGGFALLWDDGSWGRALRQRPAPAFIERERDIAAGLGWRPSRWLGARVAVATAGVLLGVISHVVLLMIVGGAAGLLGFRFAVAGRAMSRQLRMERAFLGQLRNLRDRMAVSRQSLDTALQEVGRNPGPELRWVLAPLARGGAVVDNIVECGVRSRSPLVEHACGVLIWARSRNLEAIIDAIDQVLIPVGEAQLAVREEAMVTLTQQRAVTSAMALLLLVMFAAVMRVEAFRQYYQTLPGNVVLAMVLLLFALLVMLLNRIARVDSWSRWNLPALAREQGRLGG